MAKKKAQLVLPIPKNSTQADLLNSLKTKQMTITVGPAGVGKSYIPSVYAAYEFKNNPNIKKIVLTRPTVPTGRSIGFFPGDLHDKMEPWTKPILSTIEEYLDKGAVECMLKNGGIEIVPFETIRGRSFENSIIILDEAQNCTYEEIKAFVTRVGEGSKTIINGDMTQSDLKRGESGLSNLVNLYEDSSKLKRDVDLITFTSNDIVRSGLCKTWVEVFERYEGSPRP